MVLTLIFDQTQTATSHPNFQLMYQQRSQVITVPRPHCPISIVKTSKSNKIFENVIKKLLAQELKSN